jgi:hypothetical protein
MLRNGATNFNKKAVILPNATSFNDNLSYCARHRNIIHLFSSRRFFRHYFRVAHSRQIPGKKRITFKTYKSTECLPIATIGKSSHVFSRLRLKVSSSALSRISPLTNVAAVWLSVAHFNIINVREIKSKRDFVSFRIISSSFIKIALSI